MQDRSSQSLPQAALATLIILETVMLIALLTRTPPHPPLEIALFAMAPFLGASIAVAVAAYVLGGTAHLSSRTASMAAGLLAALSFGPQKWFDPAIGRIWPAVLLAQIAILVIGWTALMPARERRHLDAAS